MVVVALMFVAGMGILLAVAAQPSPAPAVIPTDLTPGTVPTTTLVPTPDPAPKPTPAPAPKHTSKPTPAPAPAYHAPTPAPTYYPPPATRTLPAIPAVRTPSAPVATSKRSVRKTRHPRRQRRTLRAKPNAPTVAAGTKTPSPATSGVEGVRAERVAVVSSAMTGDIGAIMLLVCFVLGALLTTTAMVVPAAARFSSPGRVVIEHRLDLALLGLALFVLSGLVYLLGTVGQ